MKFPKLFNFNVTRVPTTEYRNRRIDAADFSGQEIEHLRFFGCTFTNCSFDNAFLRDLRMWNTTIRNCTFRNAILRDSGLGGIQDGRVNHFENVDFGGADMRGTGHSAATFTDCRFDDANLLKVDFQGSRFARCHFAGLLREVIFYDHAFQQESFAVNRMENVDLSSAQLRWVAFRRVSLESVSLPKDDRHVIVPNYPVFLDYALSRLRNGTSLPERILKCRFEDEAEWLGPRKTGVLNRLDFNEDSEAEELVPLFDKLLLDAPGS